MDNQLGLITSRTKRDHRFQRELAKMDEIVQNRKVKPKRFPPLRPFSPLMPKRTESELDLIASTREEEE